MSSWAVIAIAVGVVVVLGAITFVTLARRSDVRGAGALSGETRRRDRSARRARTAEVPVEIETAAEVEAAGTAARADAPPLPVPVSEAPLAPWTPPDPEALAVSRRMFLNRASVTLTATGLGAFAAAGFVAFLWPTATGGFGQIVTVGKLTDVLAGITQGSGFFYAPDARTWITEYPPEALPKAEALYDERLLPGMAAGIIAMYQKCPHLGCRVPQCVTSQWFECPCHGSQYNQVGEKKGGPAPRGMDHFPIDIGADGTVSVDTGVIIAGMAIGTNTTGQEAEGPHCISGGAEH
jgi:cytochrome b6-f complex iron-sulfur subunit